MRKKLISLALAFTLCMSLVVTPVAADGQDSAVSSNINAQNYSSYSATTVKSYLFENESGGLTRVEYTNGQIIVEDYSSSFQLQASRTIPMELTIWGGFFAGEDYNFFVFGQDNPGESDSAEVIRVVKYSKDWQRLGQASLKGANTTIPFRAGSLRCAEYDGELYIRTSHQMYKSADGLNHQANLTMCVDQERMSVLDSYSVVMNSSVGYVSHSFNQFVLVDSEKNIVTLDHGDAYPRSAILMKYRTKAGSGKFSGSVTSYTVEAFPGQIGANATGASLGGLAETSGGYVVAYNYNGTGTSSPAERTVYLSYTTKSGNTSKQAISSAGTTTPQLVSTGLNGGYILWNATSGYSASDTLYYASYNSNGSAGEVKSATGSLSDCAPIYYNGKAVWYTTDRSAPVFYQLDATGVTATPANTAIQPEESSKPGQNSASFTDVPATYWAYQYIEESAGKGWVSGTGNGMYSPDSTVTYNQFLLMLANAFYEADMNEWSAQYSTPSDHWATKAYAAINAHNLLDNIPSGHYYDIVDERLIDRYDMAMVCSNMLSDLGRLPNSETVKNAQQGIADWSIIPNEYRTAVSTCYAAGILSGKDGGNYCGTDTMTRAQACVVLVKLNDLRSAG